MNRKITCTNEDNVSLCFTSEFSPFLLQDCDGIYGVTNNVVTKANTIIDGSTYYGSTTKMRNIVLTLADRTPHVDNRNTLYKLFKPKSKGTFMYEEGDEVRKIEYYVESIDITSMNEIRKAIISLVCPDPFFYDLSDTKVVMTGWDGYWEFLHEFPPEGEEFGVRVKEQLKAIENDSSAENIGLTATFTAEADVTNISLYHVESGKFIKIGNAPDRFIMHAGERVVITTETNNKTVCKYDTGGNFINIDYRLTEDSTFIQLSPGINTLRYGADSGVEYLNVDITYKNSYLGV